MKLRELKPLNEALLLETVLTLLDDLTNDVKINGEQAEKSIALLSLLKLFTRINAGASGVVGLVHMLVDDAQSEKSMAALKHFGDQYPKELAEIANEIRVAIRKKTLYNVVNSIRGFFERRSKHVDT